MPDRILAPELGGIVPEPGAMFAARVIHPRNLELEQQKQVARRLPPAMVKRQRTALLEVSRHLEQQQYSALRTEYESLAAAWETALPRLATTSGDEAAALRDELRTMKQRGMEIESVVRTLAPLIREKRRLESSLQQHAIAIQRERDEEMLRRRVMAEINDFHQLIVSELTRMGRKSTITVKGKTYTKRVKFSEIHVVWPDQIWFKVAASYKDTFGWKVLLPDGVSATSIIDDEMLHNLSNACQRQVEGKWTQTGGTWIIVNRTGTVDGILKHVSYQQVMSVYSKPDDKVMVPVGVSKGRDVWMLDFDRHPHILIAGMTGSGKSNMMNAIITTMISKYSPDELRLVLVDMKQGQELGLYADSKVPHQLGPMVQTPAQLAQTLAQLEKLREERSRKFSAVYAKNLRQYNARVAPEKREPRVFIIIDEFSRIYLNDPYADEKENKRIANQCMKLVRYILSMARSVGIHLIICTQTVYREMLPGADKANISAKLVFRLPTITSSMVALDAKDAAEIPADLAGRMIISAGGQLMPAQAPLIEESDIRTAIDSSQHWDAPINNVVLPQSAAPAEKLSISEADVIRYAIEEVAGSLSIHKLWSLLKATDLITWRELEAMIDEIKARDNVSHQDVTYRVAKKGKGYFLEEYSNVAV